MEGEEQVGTPPISEAPAAGEQLPVATKDGEGAAVEAPAAVEGGEARAASPVDAASDGGESSSIHAAGATFGPVDNFNQSVSGIGDHVDKCPFYFPSVLLR